MGTNLTRTPASAVTAERRKFTYSCWIKKCENGKTYFLLSGNRAGSSYTYLIFQTDNSIRFRLYDGGNRADIQASDLFQDTASWYHVVLQFDSTQSTSSDRVKIYINNRQLTDLQSSTYPSQDYQSWINHNSEQGIMEGGDGTCYIAEIHQTGGQIYAPSTFGETDSTTGEWKPKSVSGITYGTNGFYLKFANAGAMGTDSSGNSNNFTVNSAGTNPQTVDTPSNLFCTFNFLSKASNVTLSEGDLKATIAGAGQSRSTVGTIAVSKGKWYWEVKYTTDQVSAFIGLVSADIGWNINTTSYPSSSVSDNVGFNDGGTKYVNGSSSSYGSGFGNNDVIGVAANLDDNEVIFYVNGTAQNSGTAISKTFSGDYYPVVQHQSSTGTSNFQINFGNPSFTISSGNADAAGFGNFEYAVPSGHFALCTRNLNTYG
jgi:hypothetical protein|tara:strand:+ start:234 stop:1523 length:1290 start_codon:yes stop_codon:yes gene_type:complete